MEAKKNEDNAKMKDQMAMSRTFSAVKGDNPQKAKELFAFMKGLLSGYDIGVGIGKTENARSGFYER